MKDNYFTIWWWFLPCIEMNQPWCTWVPHPETPSHCPPHSIPMGCPRALALSALLQASNLLVIYFKYGNIHASVHFLQNEVRLIHTTWNQFVIPSPPGTYEMPRDNKNNISFKLLKDMDDSLFSVFIGIKSYQKLNEN